MVYKVTRKTTKRQFELIVKAARKRSRRRKGADFTDLLGTAPLHLDPVKFQRMLRDEE
jgi:hypothetical protein